MELRYDWLDLQGREGEVVVDTHSRHSNIQVNLLKNGENVVNCLELK